MLCWNELLCAKTLSIGLAGLLLLIAGQGPHFTPGKMSHFGNRDEGETTHNNGLGEFVILGVHDSFPRFEGPSTLSVSFALPPESRSGNQPPPPVQVEAIQLMGTSHYYMKSAESLSWEFGRANTFGPWPTDAVIDQLHIHSDNIGVLVSTRNKDGSVVVLPADISTGSPVNRSYKYAVFFLTGKSLQRLTVSIEDGSGNTVKSNYDAAACNTHADPDCRVYVAGNTQHVTLDFSGQPNGFYNVHFVGHVPGSTETTSKILTIYHHL
jgi:hypothetical protein